MKLRLPLPLLSFVLACAPLVPSWAIEGEMQSVTWDSSWGVSSDMTPSSAFSVTPVLGTDTKVVNLDGDRYWFSLSGYLEGSSADTQVNREEFVQTLNERKTLVANIVGVEESANGARVSLIGGYAEDLAGNGTTDADVWMNISDSTLEFIVGANFCNNWNTGSVKNFSGDIHIRVGKDVSADHVVGGFLADGLTPTLTGDTYVTIEDGATVSGSIVGANTCVHSAGNTLTGDSHVYIYGVQSVSETSFFQFSNQVVCGGTAFVRNGDGTSTINGSTSVVVDLRSASVSAEQNEFVKLITGGHSLRQDSSGGAGFNITGNSSVSVTGRSGVTFTNGIYGGTYSFDGNPADPSGTTSTIDGDVSVDINGNGAAFLGNIYGAGNLGAVGGNVLVRISASGSYGEEGAPITIGGTAGATVTGTKTLELTGHFSQSDLEYVTIDNFDYISVAEGGS